MNELESKLYTAILQILENHPEWGTGAIGASHGSPSAKRGRRTMANCIACSCAGIAMHQKPSHVHPTDIKGSVKALKVTISIDGPEPEVTIACQTSSKGAKQ